MTQRRVFPFGVCMYRKSPVSWSKHVDFILYDLLIFQIAFVISYFIRQGSVYAYQDPVYRVIAVIVGLMHLCVSIFTESYKDVLRRGYMAELFASTKHVLLVVAGEVFFLFFTKSSMSYSRLNLAYFIIISIIMTYGWHCIWKKVLVKNLLNTKEKHIMLLVADEIRAAATLDTMERQLMLDYIVCGVVLLDGDGNVQKIHGVPVVADLDTAEEYLENHVVDEVLFARSRKCEFPEELMKKCELMGLTVHIEVPEGDILSGAAVVEQISGVNVLSSSVKLVTGRQLFLKRLMDIAGGMVGLLVTAVISLFLIPAILIADPGPIIFSQKRVGRNGRPFRVYKFRSMYQDAEARKKEFEAQNQISGPMFKMEADPRIIGSGKDGRKKGLGWFIRTTSLDEFPQFWNVLKGDMSLVGTRPPTMDEWEKYELHHRARLAIKPGITGMWQVSGRSDILDFDEVVRLDTEYIRNWSPALDIKILVKTVLVVMMRKGSR